MADTAGTLQPSHSADVSLEHELGEQQAGKSHDKRDGVGECRKKLHEDAETIKILERLTGRGPTLVDDAVDILKALHTTRDSIVYQLFLHDVLRHCGPGLVVLCASSLGKQRVVHLAAKDRTGLVGYLRDNKANLLSPALETLAKEYQVPTVNDPQLVGKVAGGSRKRVRDDAQQSPSRKHNSPRREVQPASERRRRSQKVSPNDAPESDNSSPLDDSSNLGPENASTQTSDVSLFSDMRPTQEVRVEVQGADLFRFLQQKYGESGTVEIKCPFGGKPLPSAGIAFGSSNILYVKMEFSMELCGAIVEHVRVAEDKVLRGKMR